MSRLMLRRAATIKRKADELFSMVNAAYGLDDFASDKADDLCCAADDLIEAIERRTLSGGKK